MCIRCCGRSAKVQNTWNTNCKLKFNLYFLFCLRFSRIFCFNLNQFVCGCARVVRQRLRTKGEITSKKHFRRTINYFVIKFCGRGGELFKLTVCVVIFFARVCVCVCIAGLSISFWLWVNRGVDADFIFIFSWWLLGWVIYSNYPVVKNEITSDDYSIGCRCAWPLIK